MFGRYILLPVALALAASSASAAHLRTIGQGAARKLVQEALVTLGEDGPWVQIVPWKYHWAPEFYSFEADRHNIVDGLLVARYFAVNPWTGDVWDAMACSQITSPAIDKEKQAIWKRSRFPPEAREALHNKSPGACSETLLRMGKKKQ